MYARFCDEALATRHFNIEFGVTGGFQISIVIFQRASFPHARAFVALMALRASKLVITHLAPHFTEDIGICLEGLPVIWNEELSTLAGRNASNFVENRANPSSLGPTTLMTAMYVRLLRQY